MVPLATFLASNYGKTVQAPGGIGGQCVDLANLWLIARGGSPVRLNAADWASDLHTLKGRPFVPNGPVNFPAPGAIVVWKRNIGSLGIGPYGHIAVVLAADANSLVTVDQDWPIGSPVQTVVHTYEGVAGWFNVL